MINFTIDNNEYQAEQGMTWKKWVNSSYSKTTIDSFGESPSGDNYVMNDSNKYVKDGNTYVLLTDTIIANKNYVTGK